MTSEFRTIVAALKTIPGLTVIATSLKSVQKEWPLPAVIVDMENPIWDTIEEDGTLQMISTRCSMVFHAKIDGNDPTVPMATIEKYVGLGLIAIAQAFPDMQLAVDLPVYGPVPFAKEQIAESLGFFLRIHNGE